MTQATTEACVFIYHNGIGDGDGKVRAYVLAEFAEGALFHIHMGQVALVFSGNRNRTFDSF